MNIQPTPQHRYRRYRSNRSLPRQCSRTILHTRQTHQHWTVRMSSQRQEHRDIQTRHCPTSKRTFRQGKSRSHLRRPAVGIPHLNRPIVRQRLCRPFHKILCENLQGRKGNHCRTMQRCQRPLECPSSTEGDTTSTSTALSERCHQERPDETRHC